MHSPINYLLNLLDAPLDVDASAGGGMVTYSHVGFVQKSFLQFRMNIVIVVDLLASWLNFKQLCAISEHFRFTHL